MLKWFSKILSSNIKGRDTVARYGGEEFAIIMPQTTLENAATIAGQIKAQLDAQFWQKPGAPNTMLRVTSSFGVAQLTDGEGTSGLIARADAKLYEAKAAGAQPGGGVTRRPSPHELGFRFATTRLQLPPGLT